MIIYRDGKEIRLTLDEMKETHKQMGHIYMLEIATSYFRGYTNRHTMQEIWLERFVAKYGFTPEQAMDPDSPHYAMEELLAIYEDLRTYYSSTDTAWRKAVHTLLERKQVQNPASVGGVNA